MGERSATELWQPTLPAGFGWCGGCARPSRLLSQPEASALLQQATQALVEGWTPLAVLEGLSWPMEIVGRGFSLGPCICSAMAHSTRRAPKQGCYLYRLWAADDRLLYVGVSTNLRARLRAHVRRWGDLIDHCSWDEHEDERSMLAAEAQAIRDELPALNKAGVG